jgi:hypothetical protein
MQLPESLWPAVMDRVLADCPRYLSLRFLHFRCSKRCLQMDPQYLPSIIRLALDGLGAEAPQESDPATRLILRLWSLGLLDHDAAQDAAEDILKRSAATLDPYPLRNPVVAEIALSLADGPDLWGRYLHDSVTCINEELSSIVDERIRTYRRDVDRVDVFSGIVDFINAIGPAAEEAFGPGTIDDALVAQARSQIEDFVGTPEPDLPHRRETAELILLRSIFGIRETDDQFSDLDE